jgi:hypothetical protein
MLSLLESNIELIKDVNQIILKLLSKLFINTNKRKIIFKLILDLRNQNYYRISFFEEIKSYF